MAVLFYCFKVLQNKLNLVGVVTFLVASLLQIR